MGVSGSRWGGGGGGGGGGGRGVQVGGREGGGYENCGDITNEDRVR